MRSKVSSNWLPSYIKATPPILEIFKMVGKFPDSPRTSHKAAVTSDMIYGHCITAILVRPILYIQKYFTIAICSVSDKVTIRICDILHYTLYHLHHNKQSLEAFGMSPACDAVSFGTFFEYHTVLRASHSQESNGCTSWFML